MQVDMYIGRVANDEPVLVVLLPAKAIPRHLQGPQWSYFGTTTTEDMFISAPAEKLEAEIVQHGYALVSPALERPGCK